MPFEKGQRVLIKSPGTLVGTVLEARPGDKGLPEERTHYRVQISDERYYLSTSLEPAEQPREKLERYSEEWLAEMKRWIESGQRLVADQMDREAREQFLESGRKLGFIVPIKP